MAIQDHQQYVQDMQRSLVDKLFFASVIDPGLVVDFGCADGALLHAYARLFPSKHLIGYDQCEKMVGLANSEASEREFFTTSLDYALNDARNWDGTTALVLSSVLHEVYTYSTPAEIDDFERRVWHDSPFDYIVIRDMMVSDTASRRADEVDVTRVRQMTAPGLLAEWERKWGGIENNRSLLHFLLTYQYQDNWDHEVDENYLPHNIESFMFKVPAQFRPIHFEHYTLPYFRRMVQDTLGIEVTDRTHVKMIFERRD